MMKNRTIHTIIKSEPTLEGAGVHLNRVFVFAEAPRFDPFLMLDDFGRKYAWLLKNTQTGHLSSINN